MKNLLFILFMFSSVSSNACSCAAIFNFCDLFSESESSILLLEIERDSAYGTIGNSNYPQYFDAKIVKTIFGPELGLDSITFMSRIPDCEFSMSLDIIDTIIIKIATLEADSNANYPTTYMLTPCLNNFLQVEQTKVTGNFINERYSYYNLDTMSFEKFLEWYPECASIIATEDIIEFSEIDIFPNPVVNLLQVINNSSNSVSYAVYNSIGRLISKDFLSSQSTLEFDMSELPSGVYYIRLDDGIKQKSQKILKL